MRPGYKGDSAAETDEAHSEAESRTEDDQEDGQEEEPEPKVWWLKSALLFFFRCLLRPTVLKWREELNDAIFPPVVEFSSTKRGIKLDILWDNISELLGSGLL